MAEAKILLGEVIMITEQLDPRFAASRLTTPN